MNEYKEFLKKYFKKKINLNYVDKLIESTFPWQGRDYLIKKYQILMIMYQLIIMK